MDTSGEVADLMVREGIQLTEESIKLLAAGSKNQAALLWALARDEKKLVGKTGMARLIREGKELKVFRLKESDLDEFKKFAKKNVLFSVVKDTKATDGLVDLVTNVDFVAQVNLFMARRGYPAPDRPQEDGSKKADPRAPQGSSSPQRGSGSTPSRTRTRPTRTTSKMSDGEKPSVKEKLDTLRTQAKQQGGKKAPQRTRPKKSQTR